MALKTTSSGVAAYLPHETGPLVIQPTLAASVAAQVATVIQTASHNYHIPIVAEDPTAAWVAEGDEIAPSDMKPEEIDVKFGKLAALSIISREMADDTDPSAAAVIGQGMARDIARRLDEAFFGNLAAPAPSGLESIASPSTVSAGAALANLDVFATAVSFAEVAGAPITAWVTTPAVALALATLKSQTGANTPLLAADPTASARRVIEGLPLYVSPAVAADTIWGIPGRATFLVIRQDVRIERSNDAYFSSDRVAIRAAMRAGFAFAHTAATIKISA